VDGEVRHHRHVLVLEMVAVRHVPTRVAVEFDDDLRGFAGFQIDGVLPAEITGPGGAFRPDGAPGRGLAVSAITILSVVALEALPDEPDDAAAALRSIRQVSPRVGRPAQCRRRAA